jgi:hypothetical protein
MAVYERNYGRYTGELTPTWSRFLVLPRYAFQEVFQSKLFVAFFVLCFALPFAGLVMIYLHHNLSALNLFGLPLEELKKALPINANFFLQGQQIQGFLAFLLAFLVGPALVAPDLRNNGMPLYLSRPFTRTESTVSPRRSRLNELSDCVARAEMSCAPVSWCDAGS